MSVDAVEAAAAHGDGAAGSGARSVLDTLTERHTSHGDG